MKLAKTNREDEMLDLRLKGRIAKTTPSMEAKFERIRFQPQAKEIEEPRSFFIHFPILAPLGAAAALALAFWLWYPEKGDTLNGTLAAWTKPDVYLEDPYYWDEALAPALPVLDPETFEAIYYFALYENKN